MNNLIIALVAWWFAEGSNLVQSAKHLVGWEGRLKPFDCPMCLAFWIGFFYQAETHKCTGNMSYDISMWVVHGIICSAIAIFISKIYYRL